MNKVILTVLFFVATAFSTLTEAENNVQRSRNGGNIVYVTQGGAGTMDGSSWSNAMADLQAAVDSAAAWGSVVWVAEGVYYGDTLCEQGSFIAPASVKVYGGFSGNESASYNLANRNFTAHPTILDARNHNRVLYFQDWESEDVANTVWDGFILQNGYASDWQSGAGAYLTGAFTLSNCIVRNNDYDTDSYCSGGGVLIQNGKISNCLIYNNSASTGGGVFASISRIENCLITHNRAETAAGLGTDGSQIVNSDIVNNYSHGDEWTVASGVMAEGYIDYGYYSQFTNCIIWGNTCQGIHKQVSGNGGLFNYCAVEGENVKGSHNLLLSSELCGDLFSPCFADTSFAAIPAGFELQQNSICINRGDNAAVADISTDLAGNNRIRRNVVDLGCFESNHNAITLPTIPDGIVYVAQGGRGTQSGLSWSNAMGSLKDAVSLAELCGAQSVWVAAGTYAPAADDAASSAFTIRPGVNVYGGFVGNEPATYNVANRDWQTNATILSGDNRMRVLEQSGDFSPTESATWSGFYLRHGLSTSSGTAAKLMSNGNLEYCIIDSNRIDYTMEASYGGIINANNPLRNWGGEDDEVIDLTRNIHIDHCIIRNNEIGESQNVLMHARNAVITNCLFADNNSRNCYEAGISLANSAMTNCDVVNNYKEERSESVKVYGDENSTLTNCIVWDELNDGSSLVEGELQVNNSAVRGGIFSTGNINLSYLNDGNNNNEHYPRFYRPEHGNYHLLFNSPCVDAGSNDAAVGSTDISGLARPYNNTVDIGCYEYSGEQYCLPPSRPIADAITGNSAHLSWANRNITSSSHYVLRYRPEGSDTWATIICDTNRLFISDLTPFTSYQAQVRSFCSEIDSTDFSDTATFTTLCIAANGTHVIVGGGETTYDRYPIYTGVRYSIGQFIYTADELGNQPILIDKIAFQYVNATDLTRYIYVKFGHTSRDYYNTASDLFPQDSVNSYFSGNFTFNNRGEENWCEIELDRPFQYDGEHNLIISLRDQTGSSSYGNNFLCHVTDNNMSVGYYRTSSPYLGLFNAVSQGTAVFQKLRPNLRLPGACDGTGCQIPNYLISNIQEHSVEIEWPTTLVAEQTEVQYRRSTDTVWTNQSLIHNPQRIINLVPNMEYIIRARTRCSATEFSEWNEKSFTTLPLIMEVIYVSENGSGLRDGSSWVNAANDLQWAIDQASSFHNTLGRQAKVYVAEGTYRNPNTNEYNAFELKEGVALYGGFAGNEPEDFDIADRDIAAHPTIVDGQGCQRILYCPGYSAQAPVLADGLILKNGYGCFAESNTTLQNCVFRENLPTSTYNCEGIALRATNATIHNCEICNNVASNVSYGSLANFSSCQVSNIAFKNNLIREYIVNANYTNLYNCLFANNEYETFFRLNYSGIVNGTLVNNLGYGSCRPITYSANGYFDNCIIWGNRNGLQNKQVYDSPMKNCAVESESIGSDNLALSSDNNSLYGPKFVNPSHVIGNDTTDFIADWHLQPNSFCINRGADSLNTTDTDLAYGQRIQNGTIDIGCYESAEPMAAYPVFSDHIIYVKETGSGTQDGTSWDNALGDLQLALRLARMTDIRTVHAGEGLYLGDSISDNYAFQIPAGVTLRGGFDDENVIHNPYPHYSVLDGQNTQQVLGGSYVTLLNGFFCEDSTHVSNLAFIRGGAEYNPSSYSYSTPNMVELYKSTIDNCLFTANSNIEGENVRHNPVLHGNGIIRNSRFFENSAPATDWSGTIENTEVTNNLGIGRHNGVICRNSTFTNNNGTSTYSYLDTNYYFNCLIANNTEPLGGINLGVYYNCNIVNNKITSTSYSAVNGKFHNSIIWGNRNGHSCNIFSPESVFDHSAVEGGAVGEDNYPLTHSNTAGVYAPHFVQPTVACGYAPDEVGDWHLVTDAGSCAINTGDNTLNNAAFDIDSNVRIQAGQIDLGCYESNSDEQFTMPVYTDGIVYVTEGGSGDGTSWQNAMGSLQDAVDVAYSVGASVWVAEGLYYGNAPETQPQLHLIDGNTPSAFYAKEGVNVYGGFVGDEPADFDLEQRQWREHPSILDGENQQRILYQYGNTDNMTTWSGFHFRNGHAYGMGGGAYITRNFHFDRCAFENNISEKFTGAYSYNISMTSYGGGVFVDDFAEFTDCEFAYNQADKGGCVYSNGFNYSVFQRCNFHHNAAESSSAIYAQYGVLSNCIIHHNHSSEYVLIMRGTMSHCDIVNNTIESNRASYLTSIVGRNYSDTSVIASNSIFWGNSSTIIPDQNEFNSSFAQYISNYNIRGCAIENDEDGDGFIALAHGNSGYGSIINYVSFADPDNGDYRLTGNSAVINRGVADTLAGEIDFYGMNRLSDGASDIGASEFDGTDYCTRVANVKFENVTGVSAIVRWDTTDINRDATFQVRFRKAETPQWTCINTSIQSCLLTDLSPNMRYEVQVRKICSDTASADWSVIYNFRTPCSVEGSSQYVMGTPTSLNYNLPFYDYYNFTITKQIYTDAEMGYEMMRIGRISLRYQNYITENKFIRIYLSTTTNDKFTQESAYDEDWGSQVLVFEGNVEFPANMLEENPNEWVTIDLDTTYLYRALSHENLVLTICREPDSIVDAAERDVDLNRFVTHKGADNCTKSWGNLRTTDYYYSRLLSYKNDILFESACEEEDCEIPSFLVYNIQGDSAMVQWNSSNPAQTYASYKCANDGTWIEIENLDNPFVIRNLSHDCEYQVRMRVLCQGDTAIGTEDTFSEWSEQTFTAAYPQISIVYVKPGGFGDGSSWTHAMGDLQEAMDYAQNVQNFYGTPCAVWVASGIYYGSDIHSESAFTLNPGVSVYGGFSGTEPANFNLSRRNFYANPTILDGAEQQRAIYQPNALTERTEAVLDGFILTHGYTSGDGGGAYLGAHTLLKNCVFRNNRAAGKGGAVYGVNSQYVNCLFANNESGNMGGAVYAEDLNLVNCDIVNNRSEVAPAGIYSNTMSCLTNCILWNNIHDRESSSAAGSLNITYSAIEGHATGEGNIPLAHYGTENSRLSPHFVAPSTVVGFDSTVFASDWSLQSNSMLLNRGNNAVVADITNDGYGNSRVQHGTVDIGCFESAYDTLIPFIPASDIIYVKENGTGDFSGRSWENACASLQDALLLAQYRDQRTSIWVAKGTYYGSPDLRNAFEMAPHTDVYGNFDGNESADFDVAHRSIDETMLETVLEGDNVHRVLYQPEAFSIEDASIWDGFTLTHGNLAEDGVGAYLQDNSTLAHCEVAYNYQNIHTNALVAGAGIYANSSIADACRITHCYVHNNSFIFPSYHYNDVAQGGGIYAYRCLIDSCLITENISQHGGGVYISRATMEDCVVEDNTAKKYGGGVYSLVSDATRCIIHNNNSGSMGGGCYSENSTTLSNCLISNNSAMDNSQGGGGIYSLYYLTLQNCDIVNNSSKGNGAGICASSYGYRNKMRNCIVWGNTRNFISNQLNPYGTYSISYCAIEGQQYSGEENIALASDNDGNSLALNYVRFNDPRHGDYTLHQSSICVNRGNGTNLDDTLDLAGAPRWFGSAVDIGCYETEVDSSCLPVTNVEVLSVNSDGVELSWSPVASDSAWTVILYDNNNVYDTAYTVTDTFISITGLHHNRIYMAQVKAVCSSTLTSVPSIPVYFTTECDTSALTPIADFNNMMPAEGTLIYYTHVDLSWAALADVTSYDLYLWPSALGNGENQNPLYSGLDVTSLEYINLRELFPLYWTFGAEFSWKVVGHNECLSKESPVMHFQVDYLPDLHVVALIHSDAMATQPMTVQWTVRNDGLGHTPPGKVWDDYVWISSTDQVVDQLKNYLDCRWELTFFGWTHVPYPFEVDETLLATVQCASPLAPGESYTSSAEVTIPENTIGSYFLYALSDQYVTSIINYQGLESVPIPYTPNLNGIPYGFFRGEQEGNGCAQLGVFMRSEILETEDGDNFFYDRLDIATPPTVDMIVSHIAHPTSVFSADTIPIMWTLTNQGIIDAEAECLDAVYLLSMSDLSSEDSAALITGSPHILGDSLLTNALLLGTDSHHISLAPDSSVSFTKEFGLPFELSGNYAVLVKTEISNNIYESVFEDNNLSGSGIPMYVNMLTPSDLSIRNITFEPYANEGMPFTIEFDVENIGGHATYEDYWIDAVAIKVSRETEDLVEGEYIETTRLPETRLLITQVPHHGIVEAGESYHVTANMQIPTDMFDTCSVICYADFQNQVFEYTYKDNNRVVLEDSLVIQQPDIIVESIRFEDEDNLDRNHSSYLLITFKNVGKGILYQNRIRSALYLDGQPMLELPQQGTSSTQVSNPNAAQVIALTPTITLYPCQGDSIGREPTTIPFNPSVGGNYLGINNENYHYNYEYDYQQNPCTYTLRVPLQFACDEERSHRLSVQANSWEWIQESLVYDVYYRESNESNNMSDYYRFTFSIEPDLEASELQAMSSRSADTYISENQDSLWFTGDDISLSWIVTNKGGQTIDSNFVDKVYISHYPNTYEGGVLIAEYPHNEILRVNEYVNAATRTQLPNGFFGTCYIHVVTDANDNICEGEDNYSNTAVYGPMTVYLTPYPDLTISQCIIPDTLNLGAMLQIPYTLTNTEMATAPVQGFVTDKVYISSSSTLNVNARETYLIGSLTHYVNLRPNRSNDYLISCLIPTGLNLRDWTVFVVTDAADEYYEYIYEDNNICSHTSQIRLNDFDIEAISLNSAPEYHWGENVNLTFHCENTTSLSAMSARCSYSLYLSEDSTLQSEDMLLYSRDYSQSIEPYASVDCPFEITIPFGAAANSYLIAIFNQNHNLAERDYDNNILIAPIHIAETPVPDLAISNVNILSPALISGQPMQLAYTTTNVGLMPTESHWTDKFFLSMDSTYGSTDIQIGNVARSGSLAPGDSRQDTIVITIPISLSGQLYFISNVNANHNFFESNTVNNMNVELVSVRLPSPGDLIVTNVIGNDTVVAGDTLSVSWTIKNIGEYALTGNGLRSLVYISRDTNFDATDRLLGDIISNNILLAQNATMQQSLQTRISGLNEGSYYLLVKTNVSRNFNESNMDNNQGVSIIPVFIKLQDLPFNTPVASVLDNNLPEEYKITVGSNINETVRVYVESDQTSAGAVNTIYVKHNGIGTNLNYTYSSVGQNTGDPEVYIPSTQLSYYGVNVTGAAPNVPSQNITVEADILPFSLQSIDPEYGGNGGVVTVQLSGSKLRDDMPVWLTNGEDTIYAQRLNYENYYRAYAEFDLSGRAPGMYDISALNYCDGTATLPQAFEIVTHQPEHLAYNLITPEAIRLHRTVVFTLEFQNQGTEDIVNPVIRVRNLMQSFLSLTTEGLGEHRTSLELPLTIDGDLPNVLRPGAYGTIRFYCFTNEELMGFEIKRVR